MEPQTRSVLVTDHAVAVPLSAVANCTQDRLKWGMVELLRVQTMGVVESIEMLELHMYFVLVDEANENRVKIQQVFDTCFWRELGEQLRVGHHVEIYGKIRLDEKGKVFLNAFSVKCVLDAQFDAFKTLCRISEMFYEKNTPCLPPPMESEAPAKLGLPRGLGGLDRFPGEFVEKAVPTTNNMGYWPVEIERLAAGRPLDGPKEDSSGDDDEDEEDEDEEEEEEDSFGNDDQMEDEEDEEEKEEDGSSDDEMDEDEDREDEDL